MRSYHHTETRKGIIKINKFKKVNFQICNDVFLEPGLEAQTRGCLCRLSVVMCASSDHIFKLHAACGFVFLNKD